MLLYKIVGLLFNLINRCTPKSSHIKCISTFPDYDDMCRGVLEKESNIIILLQNEKAVKPEWVPKATITVKKNSLLGVLYIIRSSKIYYTHGLFGFFKVVSERRQLVINLWHGMPVKNIGYLDGKDIVSNFHYVLSSSPFFVNIISQAFGVRKNQVLIEQLPRNDVLLKKSSSSYLSFLKNKYKRINLWLPTYRKSVVGDIRVDGEQSSLFGFEELNVSLLNEKLKSDDSFLIVKPHPMAEKKSVNYGEYSNIMIVDEAWLCSNNISLYELLSATDCLWTDFSSVFIDFLLVNRPILFVIPDFLSYKRNRGFTFHLDKKMLPGKVIESESALIDTISKGDFTNPTPHLRDKYLN